MNLLGFYLGYHDSNACAVIDGQVRYRKFERRSGVKHQHATLDDVRTTCSDWGFTPEAIAFSDGDRNGLGICAVDELVREVGSRFGFPSVRRVYCLDHHFAHVLSGWPCTVIGPGATGIAVDGRGDNNVRARIVSFGPGGSFEDLFHSAEFTVGRFFNRIGARLGLSGLEIDFAGKVMGAQAYGTIDADFYERLQAEPFEPLPRRLLEEIPWRGGVPAKTGGFFRFENPDFLDWLATCHAALGEALARLFDTAQPNEGPLVYAGGCAQNTVFNETLTSRFPGLVIPPHSYDGGLSLGCVEFLRQRLGLPPLNWPGFPFVQDDEDMGWASESTIDRVARLLEQGRIVGWMQGHGEIGPRALGHRSILFDPRVAEAKEILNRRVKFRETWRPYAGSVLASRASEWFNTPTLSPYMLRAIPVRPDKCCRIPGVVHRDGTCRIQTVGEPCRELDTFRLLLERFSALTGVPVLLNTSINSGGEPIYGSGDQARRLFATGRIDALCLGDELIERI